ncbi:MAG: DUF4290 domain-containing protein [Prevotella sp.]|nr:DUF4290 domain-containing protein [Prevotella sp.]
MNIEGLDYNTQREKLVLPEYGRDIQKMVDHAMTLPTKEERQQCAESIVAIMGRMYPQNGDRKMREQKLWDHLALMSNFQLDIDYPYDVSEAKNITTKPAPMGYPMHDIPVRHYGSMVFELFQKLKTMEPGEERDALVCLTANQMKRSLLQWSRGSADDAKVAADLAHYTDGVIQLDLSTFKFEKINERDFMENRKKKR